MIKKILIPIVVLVVVVLAVLFFMGRQYKISHKPSPSPFKSEVSEVTLANLAKVMPPEFLVDKDATKVVQEKVGSNQVNTLFFSKLTPGQLLDKFVAAARANGWRVDNPAKSESIAQASALKGGVGVASFQALYSQPQFTEVFIKFIKE